MKELIEEKNKGNSWKRYVFFVLVICWAIVLCVLVARVTLAEDPVKTVDDLKVFLSVDRTDEHVYDFDLFNCYDFSEALRVNATHAGFTCYIVLTSSEVSSHAIVMFSLVDGCFFVEPQADLFVDVFTRYPDLLMFTVFNFNEYYRGVKA